MALEKAKPFASDEFAIAQSTRDVLRAEQIKEDFYHRRPFAGVGIARFGQDSPNNWNPDAAINDRKHQDVEVNGADFPVCPIQCQSVRPRNAKQLHDKQREFGIRHLEFAQKALEPFVVRFLFGMAGEGGGQNRKIDCPHGIESQEKSGYKFDAGFVPRLIVKQRSLKRADVGHRAISFQFSSTESLIARWPGQLWPQFIIIFCPVERSCAFPTQQRLTYKTSFRGLLKITALAVWHFFSLSSCLSGPRLHLVFEFFARFRQRSGSPRF